METLADKKVKIDYPITWKYKVIINGSDNITDVLGCVEAKEYKCTASNMSKKGKFASYNVEVLIFNDEERLEIYRALLNHELSIRVL